MNDYITVVKTKYPCNKTVSIDVVGKLIKEASGFSSGVAKTVYVPDIESFKDILIQISEDHYLTIILGYIIGTEPNFNEIPEDDYVIVTRSHMASLLDVSEEQCPDGIQYVGNKQVVTRTKNNFSPSSWMLFDYDKVEGMPEHLMFTNAVTWWEKMIELIPNLKDAGHIVTQSTTSRIKLNGEPAFPDGGWHAYVQVKSPKDIERFGHDLLIHSLSTEYGFYRSLYSKNNGVIIGSRPWTITDPTTFTAGRLVFEGKPIVKNEELSVAPVVITLIQGNKFDTSYLKITESIKLKVKDKTGFSVEVYKRKSGDIHTLINTAELKISTSVETENGYMTVGDFWLSNNKKLRCQAPFRIESTSMAAYLSRHKDEVPFLFDVGTQTKYIIDDCFVELAKIIDIENIDLLSKAMVYQKSSIRQKVQRILKHRKIINKGDFNELIKEHLKDSSDSEYDVMKSLLELYGKDNVVFAEGILWLWDITGVWKRYPEEFIDKKLIMHPLCVLYDNSYASSGAIRSLNKLIKKEVSISGNMQPFISSRYINCLNGELHWSNDAWLLSKHDKKNYSTNQCNFNYETNNDTPIWNKFLEQIFFGTSCINGIADQIELIQAMIGYSMTADTSLEKFIVLQGPGGNGKSVLLSLLQYLVGEDNSSGVQPDQLNNKFQLGFMDKKLVNIVSEIGLDDVLPDKKIKSISSGENTTVEHKNKDPFNTRLYSTLWFASNPVPAVRDYSDAFFDRAIYFKLPNIFRGTEMQDLDLLEKLKTESTGIANNCISSYGRVLSKGRVVLPEIIKTHIESWRSETDHVRVFVNTQLKLSPELSATQKELYCRYELWAADNDIHYKLKLRSLVKRIVSICGLNTGHGTNNISIVMGVSI